MSARYFRHLSGQPALEDIPSGKRKAYEQVIGLIYECSASQLNAKLLVDKILARIS